MVGEESIIQKHVQVKDEQQGQQGAFLCEPPFLVVTVWCGPPHRWRVRGVLVQELNASI